MNQDDIEMLEELTYLSLQSSPAEQLVEEIEAIMNYVKQLKDADTKGVLPLIHPLDLNQPCRLDEVTEKSCVAELKKVAPSFEDDLYLVPKVIDIN